MARVTEEELREWEGRHHLHGASAYDAELTQRLIAEVREARSVVRDLLRGDCWCEKVIGEEHTIECERARELLDG